MPGATPDRFCAFLPRGRRCLPPTGSASLWEPHNRRLPVFVPFGTTCLHENGQSGGVLAIVAPGQGSQTPGFLAPWLELPTFANRLAWLGTVTGMDLIGYGTEADADTIRDTAIAQPLLVAAGSLAALELFPQPSSAFGRISVAAGHSVGELTAAAGAGILSIEAAMVLVRERGRLMADAAKIRHTSMTAVIGGDRDEVLAAIEAAGLTPANNNGPGQIVAAGTVEELARLAENPPQRARLIPLSVAGAFHTIHMQPAVDELSKLATAVSTHDPRVRIVSNRDGQVVTNGVDYLKRMVTQVANPVRWDLCMDTMRDMGITGLLELPPSGTLTGIAKRNLKGVALFSLNTPDQLDEARAFVQEHGEGSDPSTSPRRGLDSEAPASTTTIDKD